MATLSAMVRHHLLLPHTATRRNIEDEATVQRVVDTLDGDPVLLELLHGLAEVDSLATGPGVWSDWKAALVADLVARCRRRMAGERHDEPDAAGRRAARAGGDRRRVRASRTSSSRPADRSVATITLVAPDRPGLLSRAAGVLALHSLKVHAAELRSHAGAAVDVFSVSPRFGSLPDAGLLREQFTRAFSGSLQLAEKLAAKERDYAAEPDDPPRARVLWFDDEADGGAESKDVVLELRTADRLGLLHSVAEALETVRRRHPVGPGHAGGRHGDRVVQPGVDEPGGRRHGERGLAPGDRTSGPVRLLTPRVQRSDTASPPFRHRESTRIVSQVSSNP